MSQGFFFRFELGISEPAHGEFMGLVSIDSPTRIDAAQLFVDTLSQAGFVAAKPVVNVVRVLRFRGQEIALSQDAWPVKDEDFNPHFLDLLAPEEVLLIVRELSHSSGASTAHLYAIPRGWSWSEFGGEVFSKDVNHASYMDYSRIDFSSMPAGPKIWDGKSWVPQRRLKR